MHSVVVAMATYLVLSLVKHVETLGAPYQDGQMERWLPSMVDWCRVIARYVNSLLSHSCIVFIVYSWCINPHKIFSQVKRKEITYTCFYIAHLASRLHSDGKFCLCVVVILAEPTNLGGSAAMADTIALSISYYSIIQCLCAAAGVCQFVWPHPLLAVAYSLFPGPPPSFPGKFGWRASVAYSLFTGPPSSFPGKFGWGASVAYSLFPGPPTQLSW